jgi:hypothetical protein
LVAIARGFVEEFLVNEGEQRAAAVRLDLDVTIDSRSGVERQAQVNTSFSLGTTSR